MCFNLLLVLKRVKKKKKSLKDSEKKCRALISSWYQQLASRCSHMRPIAEGHRTPPIPRMEKLMRVWRLPFNLPDTNPRARTQSKLLILICASAMHACVLARSDGCRLTVYMYLPYAQLNLLQVASSSVRCAGRRCGAPSSSSRLRCWPACSCAWRRRRPRRRGRRRSASCRSERRRMGSLTTRRYQNFCPNIL